jgi:hypothetical protein
MTACRNRTGRKAQHTLGEPRDLAGEPTHSEKLARHVVRPGRKPMSRTKPRTNARTQLRIRPPGLRPTAGCRAHIGQAGRTRSRPIRNEIPARSQSDQRARARDGTACVHAAARTSAPVKHRGRPRSLLCTVRNEHLCGFWYRPFRTLPIRFRASCSVQDSIARASRQGKSVSFLPCERVVEGNCVEYHL